MRKPAKLHLPRQSMRKPANLRFTGQSRRKPGNLGLPGRWPLKRRVRVCVRVCVLLHTEILGLTTVTCQSGAKVELGS